MDRSIVIALSLAIVSVATAYHLKFRKSAKIDEKDVIVAVVPTAARPSMGRASCLAGDLKLAWPVAGEANKDWLIANYVDRDSASSSIRDYQGASGATALTYDGHTGVDIEVASFRVMDNGFAVLASADGVVEEVYDQSFDRNVTCAKEQKWNFVKLRHANGFSTTYAHLKKNSVAVAKGARVVVGQRLALIGSSGCSSHPHLHIEVGDCQERVLDPMVERLFIVPPPYAPNEPATLMETSLFQPPVKDMAGVQDPGPQDLAAISVNHEFSFAATIAHLHAGEVLKMELLNPARIRHGEVSLNPIDKYLNRSHWWHNFVPDQTGTWLARLFVNDRLLGQREILVTE